MKKLLSIALSLVCLFSCISCLPADSQEDPALVEQSGAYALHLQKIGSVTPSRYVDPYKSYCSPDNKTLYYFYHMGDTSLMTYHLAKIDLESGVEEDVYHFSDTYNATYAGITGLYNVHWVGDTMIFFIGEAPGLVTKFFYDTQKNEMTMETGHKAPSAVFYYEPVEAQGKELMYYNLPKDAIVRDTTTVNGILYQIFSVEQNNYYRTLNLETKEESRVDITDMYTTFYGSFLLCREKSSVVYDLYYLQNDNLVSIPLNMLTSNYPILINNFNEFLIVNSMLNSCYYFKDGILSPLTLTVEQPFLLGKDLKYICTNGTNVYFMLTEKREGTTLYHIFKGEAEPFAVLTESE
ncbi:MAG: hypothetical protein IKC72_05000 [Clostridia bacterium]|nr:hypothetical protein [Clostridia bacterium]